MQTVKGVDCLHSGLGKEWARLYELVANDERLPDKLLDWPEPMMVFVHYLYGERWATVAQRWAAWEPLQLLENGTAVVAFSGGKDSLAAALKLRALGLRPTLLHVQGINPAYSHEAKKAAAVAEAAGMSFVQRTLKLDGQTWYVESPVKNQLIHAIAVEYALEHGGSHFAMGNHYVDSRENLNWRCWGSDAVEGCDAAAVAMSKMVRPYVWHGRLLRDDTDALWTVWKEPGDLLGHVSSCMMPARYKPTHRARTERLYDLQLLPGRCGICYKCGSEYLHLAIWGAMPRRLDYAERCFKAIHRANRQIFGHDRYTAREAVEQRVSPALLREWPELELLHDAPPRRKRTAEG